MANADGSISATVSDTFYAWGAQLEVGAFPSSYIPTTTTSATRAADVVTCIGSLDTVLKSSNISIVADAIMSAGRPTGGSPSLINSSALAFYLYPVTFYSIIRTLDAGVEIGATLGSGADFFGGAKVGLSGDSGGRSIVGNGGSVTSDATAYAALTFAIYLMYGQGDPNSQWWGYFRRLTVWNSRLADATLQALTAP